MSRAVVTLHTGIEFSLTGLEYACLLLDRDLGGFAQAVENFTCFPATGVFE